MRFVHGTTTHRVQPQGQQGYITHMSQVILRYIAISTNVIHLEHNCSVRIVEASIKNEVIDQINLVSLWCSSCVHDVWTLLKCANVLTN